jgi:hypothetical protein
MRENRVTIIVVCAVLVIAVLFYFNATSKLPKYQWFENYRASSDQPYGLSILQQMLERHRPGKQFLVNDKKPLSHLLNEVRDPASTDYVFIGQSIFLDEAGTSALAKFIEAGGDVLIAAQEPPEQLLDAVYFKECDVSVEYKTNFIQDVKLNFYHEDLHTEEGVGYAYRLVTKDSPYSWDYFSGSIFCDSTRSVAALGYMDEDKVNFIKIAVGLGNLYIHSNPLVFTNYHLTDRRKVSYAGSVFAHLDGEDIIWDEFSKIPTYGNNHEYDSPLYYILQQPSLKYAWWLLLLTVLLYAVFAAKRKQRPVAVMEPKSNTSLEFVNMIARLHYKNGNHLDMAHKKMRYFLYFVRSKYGIHAEKFSDEHIRRLSEKSRVKLSEVEVIFSRYSLIEDRFKTNIEANRLVDLYDSIDNFYKQSK